MHRRMLCWRAPRTSGVFIFVSAECACLPLYVFPIVRLLYLWFIERLWRRRGCVAKLSPPALLVCSQRVSVLGKPYIIYNYVVTLDFVYDGDDRICEEGGEFYDGRVVGGCCCWAGCIGCVWSDAGRRPVPSTIGRTGACLPTCWPVLTGGGHHCPVASRPGAPVGTKSHGAFISQLWR